MFDYEIERLGEIEQLWDDDDSDDKLGWRLSSQSANLIMEIVREVQGLLKQYEQEHQRR